VSSKEREGVYAQTKKQLKPSPESSKNIWNRKEKTNGARVHSNSR
jgi:hypothetical protein